MESSDGFTIITGDGMMISFSLMNIEGMLAAYIQESERKEFVSAIAAGEPATSVHERLRRRHTV